MIVCPKCRSKNIDSARSCNSCGYQFDAAESSYTSDSENAVMDYCPICNTKKLKNSNICSTCNFDFDNPYGSDESPDASSGSKHFDDDLDDDMPDVTLEEEKDTQTENLDPGSVLAHQYRVKKVLGSGGMGVVYLVENLHLNDRLEAVKIILENEKKK